MMRAVSCAVRVVVDLDALNFEGVAGVAVLPRRELRVPVDLVHRLYKGQHTVQQQSNSSNAKVVPMRSGIMFLIPILIQEKIRDIILINIPGVCKSEIPPDQIPKL